MDGVGDVACTRTASQRGMGNSVGLLSRTAEGHMRRERSSVVWFLLLCLVILGMLLGD